MPRIVIVGANLAGGNAALTLRAEGFDGEIILIGAEPHAPYERPPLSKEYLQNKMSLEKMLVKPSAQYAEQNIETRFGKRVTRIDPRARVVEMENGERITYDQVLVATGVRNRRLRVPGVELENIFDLRNVHDADQIRAAAQKNSHAVLVGMGFIGSEVAASLRHHGVNVTVIEPFKTPLYRVLGEQVGSCFTALHQEHGVEMIFEEGVSSFEGTTRVQRVVTNTGRRVECDFVVMGVGVEPVTDLLADSGVKLENGIVVDEYCQTNVEGIYAAGDVANHFHPLFNRHLRVEHWQNAIHQAQTAARNMLDKRDAHDDVHWFWSDQYDCNVQYAGHHTGWDDVIVRGSLEARNAIIFYMQDSKIAAAVGINRGHDIQRAMALIQAQVQPNVDQLRDSSIDLRALVPGARLVRPHAHHVAPRPIAMPTEPK